MAARLNPAQRRRRINRREPEHRLARIRPGMPKATANPSPAGVWPPVSPGRRRIGYACIADYGCVKARLRRLQLRALYVPAETTASTPAIDTNVPGVQP